jgi:hypothetical protein
VLFVSPDGAGLGEDPSRALVDWLAQELQRKPAAALPASWRTHLEREVATGESPIHGIPSGPTTSPRCTTACTDWMSGPWDDLRTNCYGYACRTGSGIAIPGKGGGEPIGSSSTVDRIRAACESDGLRYLPEGLPAECGTSGWFIAVVWRRAGLGGFHSYRLNRDGTWSHKDGSRFARSVDDTQRPIEALQTAWFHYGDEFRFVGFFHCPPGHRVA